jgi:UDP-2,3-diacylglucosamine pyrophosphatase LpxH
MEKKETYRIMPPAWKELGFRTYDAYIKSRLWWNIRQLVLERDGKCCQVCGSPSKTIHHIDYTKIVMLGQGDQHQLITLCEPCHVFVEQDKNLLQKRYLLNKLFTENSSTTLDGWQVWAEKFNTDIGYDTTRIFESKRKKEKYKKHKTKKQEQQPKAIETKPIALNLRDEIDQFIKGHKKKKQKREKHYKTLRPATEESKKEFITNAVRKYSRKTRKNIRKYLDNNRPILQLLFDHPEASENFKKAIASHPYFVKELRKNETEEQKRQRKEEQYQRKREKKKAKIMGKLPAWSMNHKSKSFQGQSPLTKHIKEVKEQKGSRNDT